MSEMAALRQQCLSGLSESDDRFAIELADRLLKAAIQAKASDLHVQPENDGWKVGLRIDGVLSSVGTFAKSGDSDLVARLMVMAGLPTYRSGQPMEGRLAIDDPSGGPSKTPTLARLGVFPTVHGTRAVVRILRGDDRPDSLDQLGFSESTLAQVASLCDAKDGAILLTGPAGSGKTTTMYAMLRQIAAARPRRSVLTIEDPVEAEVAGISQSELDPSHGLTLASALRSAVRQDSEVLLVSEIREPETAEAVMQASMTGHLVFSSVHSTDVAATLKRLVAYGVPSHVIRSGVRAIIAQRLLRRLCPDCQASPVSPLSSTQSTSCQTCWGTGYQGRLSVAQCVCFADGDAVGEAFFDALDAGLSTQQMTSAARRAGYVSLLDEANALIARGLTDQAEVYRVLGK